MSKPEAEWRAFRRYTFKGIDISEERGRIRFSQTNMTSYNKTASRVVSVLCALFIFVPTFVIGSRGGEAIGGAFIWFFLSGIISAVVLVIASFAIRVPIVLEVTPGSVQLTTGKGTQTIEPEQIRSYEVRREGQHANIYMWDGPAPVYLFSFKTDQEATGVLQGLQAAIEMLARGHTDDIPEMTATYAPAPPSRPARKTFPE